MGKADGSFGYKLQVITHKDTDIMALKDMKGRKIAHVTPSSNSGNQAPRALFGKMGVTWAILRPFKSVTFLMSESLCVISCSL